MDQNRIKRNQMLGAKIVKEITARNMEAYYTDSKEEALKKALELIPKEQTSPGAVPCLSMRSA